MALEKPRKIRDFFSYFVATLKISHSSVSDQIVRMNSAVLSFIVYRPTFCDNKFEFRRLCDCIVNIPIHINDISIK